MKRAIAAFACLAILPWTVPADAQEALRLQPAGDWGLEYAADSCRLYRTFGEGEQQVILGLTAYEPRGMVFLSAVGQLTRIARRVDTVKVSLDEVEDYQVRYLQADFGGTPGLLITNGITFGPLPDGAMERIRQGRPVERWSTPEAEERVRWIGFIDGLEQEFIVETGSMRPVLQALEECAQELTTHWDIDHEAQAGLSRVARTAGPPFGWLQMQDFPRAMRQDMLINYRLIVDESGNVDGCHIMGAPEESDVFRIACEHLRERARFLPAEDANGEPVRSYYVSWADLRG